MSAMDRFDAEVEKLRQISGMKPHKHPLRWIKWETPFKSKSGLRVPPWREEAGDCGYVIASTHDTGICVILCKQDGRCYRIKGYEVTKTGGEELNYEKTGHTHETIKSTLAEISKVFKEGIEKAKESDSDSDAVVSKKALDNDLISLPQPVLVLTPPTLGTENEDGAANVAEDDEPVVQFPRTPPSDNDYWNTHEKMKNFIRHSSDPLNHDLQDVAANPNLKEITCIRAFLDTGAIPAIIDVLRIKQAQHTVEAKQNQQAEAACQILAQITVSPNIRRHMSSPDTVKVLLGMLKKEEPGNLGNLFTIIANCSHNTAFRDLVVKFDGVEQLIFGIKVSDAVAARVCYVLYRINRSEKATQVMLKSHLDHELQRYIGQPIEKLSVELVLSMTRLLYSVALYDPETRNQLQREQLQFFCQGLVSDDPELVTWSAKAFTVFVIGEDLQKTFCSKMWEGPQRLIRTLDNPNIDVILAGLASIAVVGETPRIRQEMVDNSDGILLRLKKLWLHENADVKKGTLCALGVLTQYKPCAVWTVKQNIIPDLIEYLNSTDPEYVVYSAKAIGSCCTERDNLAKLMELNGVRILWSLMKSPHSAVQAAATRALVPFLKNENAPSIVRTFVDGLDLLVGLLKSNDPEVQASACMAISEVAKDQENLAVMTDLGLVELLSRLLSSKLDSVRKPLADAIGVSAQWSNNRRRFGEEGAVDPLVSYLRPPSQNKEVHAATAKALKALSEDIENSNKLRHAGVVDYLLIMVSSRDSDLQMAAAVAIRNIRTNCVHYN